MSADEDTELRDLVAQTLEANGVLGKIRAQLRASVFLALEEQESIQNKTPFANAELKKFINTKDGRLIVGLVREFLEHFNMEFTLAVFDPESNIGDHYEGRGALARDLDLVESEESIKTPLLAQVLRQGAGPSVSRRRSSSDGAPSGPSAEGEPAESEPLDNLPQVMPAQYIIEAREKFEMYDKDHNGTIDKEELRSLFTDIFPSFHRNMLDRYVNDEFRAADVDLSNGIDFEEFLAMYKRLFVLCKSVVSTDVSDLISPRPSALSKIPSKKTTVRKVDDDDVFEGAGAGSNIVENKNKKNLDSDQSNDLKSSNNTPNAFFNDDPDDDPFFDDPIPSNNNTKSFSRSRSPSSPRSPTSPRPSKIPTKSGASDKTKKDVKFDSQKTDKRPSGGGSGGLTSLAGLPSLAPSESQKSPKPNDLEKDIKAIDRKMTDLGFDVPDDDYDDDFESSKSEKTSYSWKTSRSEKTDRSAKSEKSARSSRSVSPFGATPRSARSDHNLKSIEDELEEDIEEDLSVAEDLLKSDNSGMDDLTTDRTVSPDNQSNAIDYMEDVMVP